MAIRWPILREHHRPSPKAASAGLNCNVFPHEAKCSDANHTIQTVNAFAQDTLSHGVVGGSVI